MPQGEVQRAPGAAIGPGACAVALLFGALLAPACEPQAPAPKPSPARIALGPWVLSPATAQATVAWTTAEPAVGMVSYGTSAALGNVAREEEARRDHRVVLKGLSPQTRYRYRVEAEVPAEGTFSTAPELRESGQHRFRVVVLGDDHGGGGDHELVVRAASAEDAQLALHTGDMVSNAADPALWARWFEAERDLLSRVAFVPALGNQEISDKGAAWAARFLDKGRPAYKALDFGPLHVLVLDSFEQPAGADPNEASVSEAQKAWAEADAKALGPDRHLWVLVHQGPFSHPLHARPGHGGSEAVRRVVASLQRIHPVEAVWAGHEHFYERGLIDGMNFFVVGGGGAPLEDPDAAFPSVQAAHRALSYVALEVCGCHVTGAAKDVFGNVLDTFTLSDCPQRCGAEPAAAAPAAKPAAAGAVSAAPSAPGRPVPAPERARGIATDPSRAVATDPVRVVSPDPVRTVSPDPPAGGAVSPGSGAGEPEAGGAAPPRRRRRRQRRGTEEGAE